MYSRILKRIIISLFLIFSTVITYSYQPTGSIEDLYHLENIAKLHTGTICKMFSSYDRTGGNDDGFSGTYSKIRDEKGDSVIAEMKGSGCIQRIWFTHSVINVDGLLNRKSEHIKIYLDGKSEPVLNIPLEKLFSGELKQFPKPLVGTSLGGFYCYVPIPYKNGCKVVIEGNGVKYYQITYNEFKSDNGIETFSMDWNSKKKGLLDNAVRLWSNPGDISQLHLIISAADL